MDKRVPGLSALLGALLFLLAGAAPAGLLDQLDQLKGPPGQREFLPPDQAFSFTRDELTAGQLPLNWVIAEGYYLYRAKLKVESPDGSAMVGTLAMPEGEDQNDEEFGHVRIFRNELQVVAPVTPKAGVDTVNLKITYQGCAEDGICYPPIHQTVVLATGATAAATPSAAPVPPTAQPAGPVATAAAPPTQLSESDRLSALLAARGLPAIALTFLGFGLLLALTPCVFPMVPIVSGLVVGEHGPSGLWRGLSLSGTYVLAMATTYSMVGLAAGLLGQNFQVAFQHPAVLIAFSMLFVALALSMFGFFQLQLPRALRQRLETSHRGVRGGSLVGAAVMGALSAVIVGPCVAPPLAGALIYLGQDGSPLVGAVALFSLGLGMGVPLLLVGASAGHFLPRAGAWLERVQHVFGVVSLGMAIWFLGRILPGTATLALWALLLIGTGIFLRALEPLHDAASGWQRLWKGLGLSMVCYGGVLIVGAAAGADDVLKPLAPLAQRGTAVAAENPLAFTPVKDLASLNAAVSAAAANGRPAMLDVYADWCVECKHLERETFADPQVRARLAGYTLLRADVTANNDADRALLAGLTLFGPPAVLLFDPKGAERRDQRLIGYASPSEFLPRLQAVPKP